MKYRIYKTTTNFQVFEGSVYPTVKEARAAVLEEMERDSAWLTDDVGLTDVEVDKETYTIIFKNANGQIKHLWWGAEPIDE